MVRHLILGWFCFVIKYIFLTKMIDIKICEEKTMKAVYSFLRISILLMVALICFGSAANADSINLMGSGTYSYTYDEVEEIGTLVLNSGTAMIQNPDGDYLFGDFIASINVNSSGNIADAGDSNVFEINSTTELLLGGDITSFEYDSGTTLNFDFIFNATGGSLSSYFSPNGQAIVISFDDMSDPIVWTEGFNGSFTFANFMPVPIPSSLMLLGFGLIGIVGLKRKITHMS